VRRSLVPGLQPPPAAQIAGVCLPGRARCSLPRFHSGACFGDALTSPSPPAWQRLYPARTFIAGGAGIRGWSIDQKVLTIAEGRAAGVLFLAESLDMLSTVENCDDFEDLEIAERLLGAAAKKAQLDARMG
jgi:hypothetical protein